MTPENDEKNRLLLRQLRHDITTIALLLAFGIGFFIATVLNSFDVSGGVRSAVLTGCLVGMAAVLYRRRPRP